VSTLAAVVASARRVEHLATKGQLNGLLLGEWAVLGLLVEQPRHGFALAAQLSPAGPLGRIWTVPRPLVYRAADHLEALGLVRRGAPEQARKAPVRTVLAPTDEGRAALAGWLPRPVQHVRELRSELLVKLWLHRRLGIDPTPLVAAQRAVLDETIAALASPMAVAGGDEFEPVLASWRLHAARAAARFLEELPAAAGGGDLPASGEGAD